MRDLDAFIVLENLLCRGRTAARSRDGAWFVSQALGAAPGAFDSEPRQLGPGIFHRASLSRAGASFPTDALSWGCPICRYRIPQPARGLT